MIYSAGRQVNGHTLVDLVPPHDNMHKLYVSKAVLWVRLSLNRTTLKASKLATNNGRFRMISPRPKQVDLYIFRQMNGTTPQVQTIYPTPFFQSSSHLAAQHANSTRPLYQLMVSHAVVPAKHGWNRIELTGPIQQWFRESANARNRLTLLIDCVGCGEWLQLDLTTRSSPSSRRRRGNSRTPNQSPPSMISINSPFHNNSSSPSFIAPTTRPMRHFQPFIVVNTRTKLRKRSRRHAYNCEDGVRQCCKQSLYVDFREIGWDEWIIFPKGYTANYCMGECVQHKTPDIMAFFHSYVVEEYRTKNPYASITPCCAPTKLSPISLIYFDQDGHIIKSDLPKMVVEECGCT